MESFKNFLRFLVIIFIPFQDTALQMVAQKFGAYLSTLPLIVLMFLDAVQYIKDGARLKVTHLLAALYIFSVTSYGFFAFGIESHMEFLPLKALKVLMYMIPALYVLTVFDVNKCSIRVAVWIAFILALSGILLSDVLKLPGTETGSLLHFTPNDNMRFRGFSLEASTLGVTIGTLGMLAAYYARTRVAMVLVCLTILVVFLLVNSKGSVAALVLSFLITNLLSRRIPLVTRLVLLIAGLVLASAASAFLLGSVVRTVVNDGGVTFATRGSLVLLSWIIMFNNPFGVGLGGMLPAFSEYGPGAITLTTEIVGLPLNFHEVAGYFLGKSASAVDGKTMLNNLIIYFGIPGIIWFFRVHYKVYKNFIADSSGAGLFLSSGIIFTGLAYATYIPEFDIYCCPLVYAVAMRGRREQTGAAKLQDQPLQHTEKRQQREQM